jgi:hypothetical protein
MWYVVDVHEDSFGDKTLKTASVLIVSTDSVSSGCSELCGSEANTVVGGIKNAVEAFEEGISIDEIETRADG